MHNKTLVLHEKHPREKLLEGQKLLSFEPLNLQKNDTTLTDGLKSLCSKGPSFAPVPPHYNWLQLKKDFDRFSHSLRSRVFFANKEQNSNNNLRNNNGVKNEKRNLIGQNQKTNSPKLDTFVTSFEIDLFCNTKPTDVKDNLFEEEKSEKWRKDVLFNKESELVMRLQDKGNGFVIVDKEADKINAQLKIAKSSF